MPSIRPGPSTVRVTLDRHEAALLRDLGEQMLTLLEEQDGSDPVMQRVFPAAYDSKEDARKFRELTVADLKSTKVAALEAITNNLRGSRSEVSLTTQETEMWLTALTDMRLALGVRLEVTEEKMSSEIDPADPDAPTLSVLHWLGWLQESMLDALRKSSIEGG